MRKPFVFGASGAIGSYGLDENQKEILMLHLSLEMTDKDKTTFLNEVSAIVDELNKMQIFFGSPAEAKKRLTTFSKASHTMISAIEGLKARGEEINQDPFQCLAIYFDENLFASNPHVKLSNSWRQNPPKLEDLLNDLQETLKQLERITNYSLEKIPSDKGARLSDARARELAHEVTSAYKSIFNTMPPYARGSWFANFMDVLGNMLMPAIQVGEKPLTYANKRLR